MNSLIENTATEPKRKKKTHFILILLLLFSAVVLWEEHRHKREEKKQRWQNAVYVWQTVWQEPVRRAVSTAAESGCRIMFLAAEIHSVNESVSIRKCIPDWQTISQISQPVTAVFRLDTSIAQDLDKKRDLILSTLSDLVKEIQKETTARHFQMNEVQLDFDCPTSKLRSYGILLTKFREAFPKLTVSATVLPTWLKTHAMRYLVDELDYMVVQVHTLERNSSAEQSLLLFNADRFETYIRRASSWEIPYFLAFPTYGYTVVFDERGDLYGVYAEEPSETPRDGFTAVEVTADPAQLSESVAKLKEDVPKNCLGIAWFRLPIATDKRNWSWDTLVDVMSGKTSPL
ncbi:MAG TPA: DUF3142 domain-containing protein [Candidatus Hydrogenedentes bacterium]|nr:DUF3142 domain-containing protein [Candidatus Hydrogenedentota bacterium]HOL76916.1 DUF3142 domain-containing protein [Candidatus Hydrogenedentota bacterium]HPO85568.1 DUF3142 domain-containing protein [Candidatus Hydrogenedentota bacterium]